ncbi:MAG: Peptidase pyroglutamyl peptidase [Hyphomicrobiales bacterium]|nr:Peptidase pyroglutamyl peptidase [Hyphomicrobiales bacterium]
MRVMPQRMLTLLVTGFGPFPGAPSNPSAAIVKALDSAVAWRMARLGVRIETRILPVIFADVPGALAVALRETKPDAVLHIGLAGRRRKLGVELQARNRITVLYPDAARARAAARHVVPRDAEFRRARLPVAQLVQALNVAGATAERSRDAGSYVCNQTLYLTLGDDIPLAGFIHIPRPRGNRPLSRARTPRLSLAQMADGIVRTLIVIAHAARRP